uniref:Uncharacterized protein n=1 Tax=Arundo donax TaxID=35708 RepID=A0A0A9FRM2_ARUDO
MTIVRSYSQGSVLAWRIFFCKFKFQIIAFDVFQ